jgi:hypothetical protein
VLERPSHGLGEQMKERSEGEKKERTRIRRLLERQNANEMRVSPGYQTHEQLWQIVRKLLTDFEPYGQIKRQTICDCSGGCRWFHVLAGRRGQDWGVCANAKSPRASLLTFEHCDSPKFHLVTKPRIFESV